MSRDQRMVQQLIPGLFDSRDLDWTRVARSRYLIEQTFRYRYRAPIAALRQRLVIEPPARHGGQRVGRSQIRTSAPGAVASRRRDAFGNTVIDVEAPEAGAALDFQARIEVEWERTEAPIRVDSRWLGHPRLCRGKGLTAPGEQVRAGAAEVAREGLSGLGLAERVNAWVQRRLRYQAGVTTVTTTAEEALRAGAGVCQDYAHVMLALCRALGLPARYVSGHLLGEGGTHAWVEVLTPARGGSPGAEAHAFDPTHGRRAGAGYVTVAVGADYRDVAPTSGTYRGGPGQLDATKRVDIVGFAYR